MVKKFRKNKIEELACIYDRKKQNKKPALMENNNGRVK